MDLSDDPLWIYDGWMIYQYYFIGMCNDFINNLNFIFIHNIWSMIQNQKNFEKK